MMLAGAGQRTQIHLQREYLLEEEKSAGHFSEERRPRRFLPHHQRAGHLRQGANPGFTVHYGKPGKLSTTTGSSSLGDGRSVVLSFPMMQKTYPGEGQVRCMTLSLMKPFLCSDIKNLPDLRDIERT